MKTKNVFAALFFGFILMSCTPTTNIVSTETIIPATMSTQSLDLATDYVAGLSELTPDDLLFVVVKSNRSGSGTCNLPVVEQAPLAFWYSSNTLEISSFGSSGRLSDNALIPVTEPKINGLGFFGYIISNDYALGGGTHAEIYYIDKLPYKVSHLELVIYSALKDGTLVAGVEGQVYKLEPYQSWVKISSHEYPEQPDCQMTNNMSITNYGSLNSSDVKFVDEPILR
jgi:hypothetical protein